MKIYPFEAVYPKVDLIASAKSFFSDIKQQYRQYRKSGIYESLSTPGIYIYQIKTETSSHIGLICCTDVNDITDLNIKKHEETLADKEQKMMGLILQRKALVKPVLLGYHSNDNIKGIITESMENEPLVSIPLEENKVWHTIWTIENKASETKLINEFAQLTTAYIGDGHHRTTTIQLLSRSKDLGEEARKYDQFLTAYFDFKELKISDFNRVVDIAEIIPLPEFIIKLSKYFDIKMIKKEAKPKKKHVIVSYIAGNWYKLKWKKRYLKQKDGLPLLDSALVNQFIFQKILGIIDVRLDKRIQYFGGTQTLNEIQKAADTCETGVALCIFPVTVEELTTISDRGLTLPPKSTYFLPRLLSGIIAKDLTS